MPNSEHIRKPANQARLESFQAAVRAAGIKLTHQRLEVFRELARTTEHPDAETIFKAVQRRVPTVSLDTVYRTLWMLRDLGLVTTLGSTSREGARFDVNSERHHHYVCMRCGLIRDFTSDELDSLRVPAAVKGFGTILDTQVEVRGLCASCQEAPARTTKGAKASLPRNRSEPK